MFNTFSWDFYSSHLTSPLSGGATVTSSCAVFLFQMCAAFSFSPISSFAFKLLAGGSIVEKSRRWVRQVRGSISFFMIRYIYIFLEKKKEFHTHVSLQLTGHSEPKSWGGGPVVVYKTDLLHVHTHTRNTINSNGSVSLPVDCVYFDCPTCPLRR